MILPNLLRKSAVLLILPLLLFVGSAGLVNAASSTQLLTSPWTLSGNNGAAEKTIRLNSPVLAGQDTLQLTYNLHGVKLLGGDASAIIFDQPNGKWHYVSLSNYGQNGLDGVQTVNIPLSAFPGLDTSKNVSSFHVRFWSSGSFTIDITSALVTTSAVVPAPSPTPAPSLTPAPTTAPSPVPTGTQLLSNPWNFTGSSGAVEKYQSINPNALLNQTTLTLTYNLHGAKLLGGDASAIIFDQGGAWRYISLANYGQNGYDGVQTVSIPLSSFPGLNPTQPVGTFHARFWYSGAFNIDITSATVSGAAPASSTTPSPTPSSTPAPTPSPTPVPVTAGSWAIQSVSSMKETKDKICGQDSQVFINSWVDKAKELGVNYVAVETPYDSPSCGNVVTYAKSWIDTIRSRGLKVWHRHMPLAFEAIYSTPKVKGDYFNMISSYIKNNPSFFQEGDIFTPIPEPQNGGIAGITSCSNGVCQFDNAAHFNRWLRDAMDVSESAFASIGMGGKLKLGYYGFDGFVAWGSNNPDWNGILEDATVAKMGNITIDHYPELIGQTMTQGLNELQAKYPNTPIIIGEWGSTGTTNWEQQVISSMGAAKRPGVVGFNYWHMGMGGNEALINSDFTNRVQFDEVQSYFKNTI